MLKGVNALYGLYIISTREALGGEEKNDDLVSMPYTGYTSFLQGPFWD